MCYLLKIAAAVYNSLFVAAECSGVGKCSHFVKTSQSIEIQFLLPFFGFSTNKSSVESVVFEIGSWICRKYATSMLKLNLVCKQWYWSKGVLKLDMLVEVLCAKFKLKGFRGYFKNYQPNTRCVYTFWNTLSMKLKDPTHSFVCCFQLWGGGWIRFENKNEVGNWFVVWTSA